MERAFNLFAVWLPASVSPPVERGSHYPPYSPNKGGERSVGLLWVLRAVDGGAEAASTAERLRLWRQTSRLADRGSESPSGNLGFLIRQTGSLVPPGVLGGTGEPCARGASAVASNRG